MGMERVGRGKGSQELRRTEYRGEGALEMPAQKQKYYLGP